MDDDVQSAIDDLKSDINSLMEGAENLQKQVTEALNLVDANKPQPVAPPPVTADQFADLTKQVADLTKQVADIHDQLVQMGDVRGTLDKLTEYLRGPLMASLASGNSAGGILIPPFSP